MSSTTTTIGSDANDVTAVQILLDQYQLSEEQQRLFHAMKNLRNKPSIPGLSNEDILWAVAVGTLDMPESPTKSDVKFYERIVEERVRKYEQAESTYGWFSGRWTKATMKRLIRQWFCGMLVIDPALQTSGGSPIQFVYEYYGEDSGYPRPKDQTEEWKKESMELYVLMARSICRSYPMSTTKGIVSLSDMQDFDWDVYDMGTKERNADIGSVVPNKLKAMITFHPDEKMRGFYDDMTPRLRKKYGFELYDDFESVVEAKKGFFPEELPTFMGGTYRVNILECMKYLFRREPEALALLLEVHSEMEASDELPNPEHMK
jgi:hypothetical protein